MKMHLVRKEVKRKSLIHPSDRLVLPMMLCLSLTLARRSRPLTLKSAVEEPERLCSSFWRESYTIDPFGSDARL